MSDQDYIALAGDVSVIFYFDVGELHIARSKLSTTLEVERDGLSIFVNFPDADGQFQGPQPERRPLPLARIGEADDPYALFIAHRLQVRVELGHGLGSEGSGNAEYALIREAEPAASAVVRGVLDWARVRDGQVWLPLQHAKPRPFGAWLTNQAGETTHSYGTPHGVMVVLNKTELPTGDIAGSLKANEVPEAESLLAEARWAVWPKHDPDTKRAVLFAAIALEIKTPQVLLAVADGTSRRLLEVLFKRPDETSMSVNFQMNALAEVVLGSSLKDHDGRLAKAVRDLYLLRNDVVHRGQTPDAKDARDAVTAAESAFRWLGQHLED